MQYTIGGNIFRIRFVGVLELVAEASVYVVHVTEDAYQWRACVVGCRVDRVGVFA